jgi:hypothetical protein
VVVGAIHHWWSCGCCLLTDCDNLVAETLVTRDDLLQLIYKNIFLAVVNYIINLPSVDRSGNTFATFFLRMS